MIGILLVALVATIPLPLVFALQGDIDSALVALPWAVTAANVFVILAGLAILIRAARFARREDV